MGAFRSPKAFCATSAETSVAMLHRGDDSSTTTIRPVFSTLSRQDAKSGQFSYYVCQSIMKRGKDACKTPRLNARRFEEIVVGKIRSNVLMTCPPRTGPGVMLVLGLKERGVKMARRKHTAEQIINKLREAEVAISAGSTVAEVSRQIGVTQQTFYRWRTEYGGLKIDQARRLKQLETENGRLRRAVADLTLDNQILREAAEGNF